MTVTPSELAQMFVDIEATEWTCGHSSGSACRECFRDLAEKARLLAEENERLVAENEDMRAKIEAFEYVWVF